MAKIFHRKTIRLPNYDYRQSGYYFITICAHNRVNLFGRIENDKMVMNKIGKMVYRWWQKLPAKYRRVQLDKFIIMPNHIHGIIRIVGAIPCNRPVDSVIPLMGENTVSPNHPGENTVSPLQQVKRNIPNTYDGLGRYISWFKRMTTNEYIRNVKQYNWPPFAGKIWQRNYYERIIRNQKSLENIRQYIINNPRNWVEDTYYKE